MVGAEPAVAERLGGGFHSFQKKKTQKKSLASNWSFGHLVYARAAVGGCGPLLQLTLPVPHPIPVEYVPPPDQHT